MRYTIIAVAILILEVGLIIFYRFWTETSAARQKVLSGSEVFHTDLGDIEYAVQGQGTPVLVLHGAAGGYDQGLMLGKTALGDGHKQIAVSRFGYLRSSIPKDSSPKAQAALYATLLDHLKIDKIIVVAMSAGGPSALQFAHDFPDRTSALVMFSAQSQYRPPKNTLRMKIINATIMRSDFLFWVAARAFQSQFLELFGISPEIYKSFTAEQKEIEKQMFATMYPMSLRAAGVSHEIGIRPLDGASMAEISVPTLILHAKDDKMVSYEQADYAHKNIKQSQLVLFGTGGHGMLPKLKSVREHVKSFLKESDVE